jgi:membrane protein implicated in regulation of membrane protease activity
VVCYVRVGEWLLAFVLVAFLLVIYLWMVWQWAEPVRRQRRKLDGKNEHVKEGNEGQYDQTRSNGSLCW